MFFLYLPFRWSPMYCIRFWIFLATVKMNGSPEKSVPGRQSDPPLPKYHFIGKAGRFRIIDLSNISNVPSTWCLLGFSGPSQDSNMSTLNELTMPVSPVTSPLNVCPARFPICIQLTCSHYLLWWTRMETILPTEGFFSFPLSSGKQKVRD